MENAKKVYGHTLYPEYKGRQKMVSIHYDSRAVREANRNNITIHKKSGEWNGYTFDTLDRYITASNAAKIRKILAKIDKRNAKKSAKPRTPEQKITSWAKRLDKLTNCGLSTAKIIAQEKISYEWERLEHTVNLELNGWKIPAWMKEAERRYFRADEDESTLLKRIQDEDHAQSILGASHRHNETNYEDKLGEAKELAETGEIEKEEIQDWARLNHS